MIKKAGAWLLALLYVVTATLFALSFQYRYKDSVKIVAPARPQKTLICKSRCCKEKHLEIKVKEVQKPQLSTYFDKLFAVQLPTLIFADFLHAFKPAILVSLPGIKII